MGGRGVTKTECCQFLPLRSRVPGCHGDDSHDDYCDDDCNDDRFMIMVIKRWRCYGLGHKCIFLSQCINDIFLKSCMRETMNLSACVDNSTYA